MSIVISPPVSNIGINGHTYTNDHWEANPQGTLSGLGNDIAALVASIGGVPTMMESVSALRANSTSASIYYLAGWRSTSPGRGAGIFVLDPADTTSADDGGTIIVDAAGQRFKRRIVDNTYYATAWFGAALDGTTDDTAACQKCIDVAYAAGAPVWFSTGTSATTGLTIYEGQEYYFAPGAVLKLTATGQVLRTMVSPGGAVGPGYTGVRIVRPTIDMNSHNGCGILIEAHMQSEIFEPEVKHVPDGTFTYSDSYNPSGSYPTCGILVKGISDVEGAYYTRIINPKMTNGVSPFVNGGTSGVGVYFGTSDGGSVYRPNVSQIIGGRIFNYAIGFWLAAGSDTWVEKTDFSYSGTGIKIGGKGVNVTRTTLVRPYLECCDVGMEFTEDCYNLHIKGIPSFSVTTTPIVDNSLAGSSREVDDADGIPINQFGSFLGQQTIFLRAGTEGAKEFITCGASSALYFTRQNGALLAPTAILAGDALGTVYARGYDGTRRITTGKMLFSAEQLWTDSQHGTSLQFWLTGYGSSTPLQRVRIEPNGCLHTVSGGGSFPASGNTGDISAWGKIYQNNGELVSSPATRAAAQTTANSFPDGTTSTTPVMMGIPISITPLGTGRILVIASGDAQQSIAGYEAVYGLRYARTASIPEPANGDPDIGTLFGTVPHFRAAANNQHAPFSLQALMPTLTVGYTYWIDMALNVVFGGTATLNHVVITAIEL